MRPLGTIPTRPLRVIPDEDTSPETEGENCTRFPRVLAQNLAALLGCNECKRSPYKIKKRRTFCNKVDNRRFHWGFSKRARERDGHGRNDQQVDRNKRKQYTTRYSTSREQEVDTWTGTERKRCLQVTLETPEPPLPMAVHHLATQETVHPMS